MNKKITALMPIKNGAKFLPTILPVLKSNMDTDDEVIIIDDHSNDESITVIKNFKEKHEMKNWRILKNPENGLVGALNFGIQQSTNEWIARFDVDDFYVLDRVSIQKKYIAENVSAVFSDYDILLNGTKYVGTIPTCVAPCLTAISLINSQRTAHPSVLFSKSAVIEAGSYINEDFPAEDLSLWLRMSKNGNLIGVPKTLLYYNLNPNSTSFQLRQKNLTKKRQLINNIGIDLRSVELYFEDRKTLHANNKTTQFATVRDLLSIYDVLKLNQYGYLRKSRYASELIYLLKELLNFNNLAQIKEFENYRKMRIRIRNHAKKQEN